MDNSGGIFQYTSQLSNAISRRAQITVITPIGINKSLFENSVKVVSIPVGDTKKNFLINTFLVTRLFNFLKTIRKENPDVIHFQNAYSFWASAFLPFLARKYKIITTLHDVEPHLGYKRLDKMVARSFHLRYSHCFIVHCEKEKEKLVALGIKKKIYTIPHGDYSFFTRYSKKNVEERDAVLFFGNTAPYKGLEYLLKAMPLITKKLPNAKIIIAGKGDLKRYAKLITPSNIEVYNKFIPNEEVAELFQMAKVIALPYIEATQSGIIPIAYAFKKPVVTTSVGCIPDIVDNERTGIIVPPKDVNALAEAIIKLLKNDELRREMGKNAYIKMKEELSWDKIAEKTITVYNEAVTDNDANK